MDCGVDLCLVHALVSQVLQRFQDHLLHLLGILGCDVLQACTEDAFAIVVLEAASVRHRGTEL
jgi:hypothetical protein